MRIEYFGSPDRQNAELQLPKKGLISQSSALVHFSHNLLVHAACSKTKQNTLENYEFFKFFL